jgi:hypothetical protein
VAGPIADPDLAYNQPFFGAGRFAAEMARMPRATNPNARPGPGIGQESRLNKGAPPKKAAHIHVSDRNPQRQEAL